MDVSKLVPTLGSGGADGPRRAQAETVRASLVDSAPARSIEDRVERSAELDRQIDALKRALDREPRLPAERIDELRAWIGDANHSSYDVRAHAALGILHGERFFQQSDGSSGRQQA